MPVMVMAKGDSIRQNLWSSGLAHNRFHPHFTSFYEIVQRYFMGWSIAKPEWSNFAHGGAPRLSGSSERIV